MVYDGVRIPSEKEVRYVNRGGWVGIGLGIVTYFALKAFGDFQWEQALNHGLLATTAMAVTGGLVGKVTALAKDDNFIRSEESEKKD